MDYISFGSMRGNVDQQTPEEVRRGWTWSFTPNEESAVWRAFDDYLVNQTGGMCGDWPTRIFVHFGGYGDPNPRCYRLSIADRKVVVERCDSRFLIGIPDDVMTAKFTRRLVQHFGDIRNGWTYIGGGCSMMSPPMR